MTRAKEKEANEEAATATAPPAPPAGATRQEQDERQQEQQQDRPREYDAQTKQHAHVLFPVGDELAQITLTFDPTAQGRGVDYLITEYARRAAAVEEADTDEDVLAARASAQTEAMAWLFDAGMTEISGIEGLPQDWRTIFSAREKQSIVERSLFAVNMQQLARKVGPVVWGEQFRHSTIRLRCFFDGGDVETAHVLRKPDARLLRDFNALLAKALSVSAADASTIEFAPFYDRLKVEARGYKNGIVPVHHRAVAAMGHLLRQAQVVRKN